MDDYIKTDYEKVTCLKNTAMARATGGRWQVGLYERLRQELLGKPHLSERLPSWLRTCRTPDDFWQLIKVKFGTYAERRQFLTHEFDPVLTFLENGEYGPAAESVSDTLERLDAGHIQELWKKALDRRIEDPEGAITAARTLLESVCKCILDESSVDYSDDDLPKLYSKCANTLKIAPSQHTELVFKQILGGCHAVVEGLGSLRNRLSDAHGQGKRPIRPAPRHAELAVNLAGAMATFIVATFAERRTK